MQAESRKEENRKTGGKPEREGRDPARKARKRIRNPAKRRKNAKTGARKPRNGLFSRVRMKKIPEKAKISRESRNNPWIVTMLIVT